MIFGTFSDFLVQARLLYKNVRFNVVLGSSTQNHAESYGNYGKNAFVDPKRAKFYEKSEFWHVQWLSRSPGPV